jgi:hypothetical protein
MERAFTLSPLNFQSENQKRAILVPAFLEDSISMLQPMATFPTKESFLGISDESRPSSFMPPPSNAIT